MNKKNIRIIANSFIICLIFVFSFSVISMNDDETLETSTSDILSDKKIEWGIKRGDNHVQPDLGSENKRIIDKYEGISMGNSDKPYVYLTFDCGYEAGYTEKILEVLKQNDVKATFFITGHYLNSASDLVKKMIEGGHIIGNHTADHICMPESTNEEIKEDVMELHTALYNKFRLWNALY